MKHALNTVERASILMSCDELHKAIHEMRSKDIVQRWMNIAHQTTDEMQRKPASSSLKRSRSTPIPTQSQHNNNWNIVIDILHVHTALIVVFRCYLYLIHGLLYVPNLTSWIPWNEGSTAYDRAPLTGGQTTRMRLILMPYKLACCTEYAKSLIYTYDSYSYPKPQLIDQPIFRQTLVRFNGIRSFRTVWTNRSNQLVKHTITAHGTHVISRTPMIVSYYDQ